MSLLDFLGLGPPQAEQEGAPTEADTIRKIVRALQEMEPERAKHLAAFAFILSRVANADMQISDDEQRQMEHSVMAWGGLPEEQAVLVVQIAINQNVLFGGTDNFIVTREFRDNSTRQQKEELLHCLFAVSAADDSISSVEENTIAQIARELGLDHRDLVAIRAAYRDKRAVLKNLPRSG
ncbi:MAG: TerB family tellurite resistance protein [Acidobacteriota bacterium]